jgi:C4-dicarboxylate-specific signal transduction histidine kinase
MQHFARHPAPEEPEDSCAIHQVLDEALRLASVRLRAVARVEQQFSARHLSQVLVNLLGNAADALGGREGGRVRVVAQLEGSGWVRLSVEDNGPGIAPAVLERLFEPFVSTKGPGRGTGLGLTLSREYVERFGGSLEGHTLEGGGATFILSLRAAAAAAG